VHLVEDHEAGGQCPKIGVGVGEPALVRRTFEVEIHRAPGPRVGDLAGKRRLTDLARAEEDDRRRARQAVTNNGKPTTRDHACKFNSRR
jgi:hypothetical protein